MLERRLQPLPEHIYPPRNWSILETEFDQEWMGNAETIFALANGFLGIRGIFEEGRPAIEPATFCNGFHETWPIVHAEEAYGFARTGQTIVNVPDTTLMKLYVDDEPLYLPTARLTQYRRELDFREGVLDREMNWSSPAGKQVHIRSKRLVSFEYRHVSATSYEVTIDTDAPVVISSQMLNRQDSRAIDEPAGNGTSDPRRAKAFAQRVLHAHSHTEDEHRICTGYRTTNSKMTLGSGMEHVIETENTWHAQRTWSEDLGKVVFTIDAKAGVPIRITKYATYHTSRAVPPIELVDRCNRTLDRCLRDGYSALEETQRAYLHEFWDHSDVYIDAETRIQQAARWNIYQLCQASARAETTGIPAKGLTGQAYEGHYFWDTEVYVTPFLSYTSPRTTRNLIRFRHSMLDKARERARELSEQGALFPWRTINGEEASSYYAAGTAQYHINADIAYAIKRYVDVRGDEDLLNEVGAEILVETARMWVGLGFFNKDSQSFHIHGVTGPDEYTTVVNDNTFTNLMARLNLRYAAWAVRRLQEKHTEDYARLVHETNLDEREVAIWDQAAEQMHIPYDEERGILPQDENFLKKEVWDFASTPADHYPLLLHYHPLVIYRHQVIKQADVVLALVLLGNEFSIDEKRRNFDYYDPLTTGDSSLSACVQAILAAEIGYEQKAVEYFDYALLMDLANVAGNVVDGAHVASTGGVWMALTYGFGGMRDYDGKLSFDPRLPKAWSLLRFRIRFHDSRLEVEVTDETFSITLIDGPSLAVTILGTEYTVAKDQAVTVGFGS
ncbi:MAG: glycoside hydrolase family 65 protein [Spirochaetales bacterium]